ncbi:OmpA family protein [Providencia stuartii]|uniref:OmpA family protein n=1 Tax=Providencia stuartii TaxID=588 RepID=UPI003326BD9B
MQNPIKQCLTIFATGLFLWLIWGFWSLGQAISLFFTILVVVISGGLILWRYKQQQNLSVEKTLIDKLPDTDYQGAVVLVCGQSQGLFSSEPSYRETPQGWYIGVNSPTELVSLVQTLHEQAPAQLEQLSLLFAIFPEQLTQQENLTQDLLSWRRAMGESRQKVGKPLPFWVALYLSPQGKEIIPVANEVDTNPWFTLLSHQREFQVVQEGAVAEPLSVWLSKNSQDAKQHFQATLWFDQLLDWLQCVFIPQLTVTQVGAPVLIPSAWGIQWITVDSQPNNLWQQFIQGKTTLQLHNLTQTDKALPLPDVLLGRLRHDVNLNRRERVMGVIGVICGVFLVGALCGSYQHNRQLIRHIGEDVVRFGQLSDSPADPKLVAYQQLQKDATQLARWEREGIPTAYSLALYQGGHILPYLHTLLSGWAPPAPPAPVIVQEAPQVVSLDSLALFDVGQHVLKPGATKVLVDALINIRAKPGWLIVISGYTDSTGNPELNQKLSLRRAESVRDWMIETSDIEPSCFAVQGYGQSHPIASNETPEGRARNRRVEIRLMPQAEACQLSNFQTVSPMEGDTHVPQKEK